MSVRSRGRIQRVVLVAALSAMTLGVPGVASAATIVMSTIGTFSWIDDGFFGPEFSLQNDSLLAGVSGVFTNVNLTLTSADDFDGDGALDTVALWSNLEIPGAGDPGSRSIFDSPGGAFTRAILQFEFSPLLPAGATPGQPAFTLDLSSAEEVFLAYSYELPDTPPDPDPVPEPGTLGLLGIGLVGARVWRHRIRSAVHGVIPGPAGRDSSRV